MNSWILKLTWAQFRNFKIWYLEIIEFWNSIVYPKQKIEKLCWKEFEKVCYLNGLADVCNFPLKMVGKSEGEKENLKQMKN